MNIDTRDISIVVQGAVLSQYTPMCLNSIRKTLPGSEIVLSTWKGSDTIGLDYDCLVLSKDPGNEILDPNAKIYNNINRQIVSTQAGIAAVKKKYCLKFRTDILLNSSSFLDYYKKFDTNKTPAQYFQNRILICSYHTRNPRIMPLPFHLSDWVAFGLTKDLKKYYDMSLQSSSESLWFQSNEKHTEFMKDILCRYTPEQYISLSFIRKYQTVHCDNYYDVTAENICLTENFLANNTIVLDYGRKFGIRFLKYNPNQHGDKYNVVYYRDWYSMYRRYSKMETGLYWNFYLFRTASLHFMSCHFRRFVIKILDYLGIKQLLKKLLGRK